MNYRHHFHAGNFADVLKHVLLLALIKGMQRKEKGFLYLDTHAGRGLYDLSSAAQGGTQERQPEWPEGIGRLWYREDAPPLVQEYLRVVRACQARGDAELPASYPGSPWLARALLRDQDRLHLCELHPEEFNELDTVLGAAPRTSLHRMDGYTGIKAALPPPERRALVLIDPPFEAQDEFERLAQSVGEALRRLPAASIAVWYPLTQRARVDAFFDRLALLRPSSAWTVELTVAGEASSLRMRGCGLLVINPPWQLDEELRPLLPWLGERLAQDADAEIALHWLARD